MRLPRLLPLLLVMALMSPAAGPVLGQSSPRQLPELERSARRETVYAALSAAARAMDEAGRQSVGARLRGLADEVAAGSPSRAVPELAATLGQVLSGEELARQLSALTPIEYGVRPLTPAVLLRGETEAYRGVLVRTPLAGYDAKVQALEPGAPHSMEDVGAYVRHRVGGHVLALALEQRWPVEFHEGPMGLALRSLRQRGYGSLRLLTAPGLGADRADGFVAAVRMTDGAPVLAHAGSLGRDRFLHAQALLRLAGVPAAQVVRFEHRYRLEDALSRLDLPAATPGDVAVLGLSDGPIRSLLRRMGLSDKEAPVVESPGAPFLQMRRLRFRDDRGEWHRLLALGVFWGELAGEAAYKLAGLGYRRIAFLGIAGGLAPDARLGDIHHVGSAVDVNGSETAAFRSWLVLPRDRARLLTNARLASTWSPLTETERQVEGWRRAGVTTVETEIAHVLRGLVRAGRKDVRFDALAIVSDVPGAGGGKSLESRYYNRSSIASAGEHCTEWLLGSMRATALEAESGPPPVAPERIGLFTGTFDPPHKGHLKVAAQALEALALDRFVFLPNGTPRHKPNASPYRARSEMLWASICDDPRLQARAGPAERGSYAAKGPSELLRQTRLELGPGKQFFQVMGADSFLSLAARPRELSEATAANPIAVFLRPGTPDGDVRRAVSRAPAGRVLVVPADDAEETSSTALRARLRRGETTDGWMTPSAWAVLRHWRLYGAGR